jgi:O-acetyl-ADP-ribose deacetylase (regulator of RNase III)
LRKRPLINTSAPTAAQAPGVDNKRRRCFIISPIGEEGSPVRIHADDVMEFIIKPALERCGIAPVRSDQIAESGAITEQMFREIVSADVCVVLLTGFNPNVFYELAIAQAAARPVVILIEKGLTLPFDVKDLRCIQYELAPVTLLVKGVYADRVQEMLEEIRGQGWRVPNLFEHFGVTRKLDDELQVRHLLDLARPEVLPFGVDRRYALPADPKREICLLTGDITEIQNQSFGVDVVVSLENTDLQLGRYYDADSVSGILRYLDAERSADGQIAHDCLDQSLRRCINELGIVLPTAPGRVIATPTTRLHKEYGVKYVFHAAALQGSIGDGYEMLDYELDDCVLNVFDRFAETAQKAELSSILFPMLGAATTNMDPAQVAGKLLGPIVHRMTAMAQCKRTVILARLESHRQGIYLAAAALKLQQVP